MAHVVLRTPSRLSLAVLFSVVLAYGCGDEMNTSTAAVSCDKSGCARSKVAIAFWAHSKPALGALGFVVEFPADFGTFQQDEVSSVDCNLAPDVDAAYAANETKHRAIVGCDGACRRLHVSLLFAEGLSDSGPILFCSFLVGDRDPTTDDFHITVVDASDVNVGAIEPLPTISLHGLGRP